MKTTSVYLAAEDEPGLAVGQRLLAEHASLRVYIAENGHGYGNLKRKTANYNEMARNGLPVLLITDLDRDACPGAKISRWLGRAPNPDFLFRICVREVEAWLLADTDALAGLLRVKPDRLPREPESLRDPKRELIQLARAAPRPIRIGLTPQGGASIGPRYNEILTSFISDQWSLSRAVKNAPSLERARLRVEEMAGRLGKAHTE